jgi:hypothetical protein
MCCPFQAEAEPDEEGPPSLPTISENEEREESMPPVSSSSRRSSVAYHEGSISAFGEFRACHAPTTLSVVHELLLHVARQSVGSDMCLDLWAQRSGRMQRKQIMQKSV